MFDELLDLTTPLTDQADDDDVGLGETGHHTQQHALAHAGTGEQAQALTTPYGQQAVDTADTDVQRLADRVAIERVDGRAIHRHPVFGLHPALAIQRPSGTIKDPSKHTHAHRQTAIIRQRHYPRARCDAGNTADGHKKNFAASEAHDLRLDPHRMMAVVVDYHAAAANGGTQAFGLQGQTDHTQQAALDDRLGW
ncbi:hypothetical protein D3C78_1085440 [compost metagenome]